MKRVFLYARVSTEEQAIHGLSIEAQTLALEEWAKASGHKIVDTYVDAGISARKPASKRPALQRLLSDIRAGKGDLIVFTKLDRWFRNIAEYYKVQEVLEKYHIDWKTIHEDYDTSTASGRLKINIMLSVAQDEADRTSERIRAVYEIKRQKLEPLSGNAPTGYKIEGKHLIKDPATEGAVNTLFQNYMSTGSISGTLQKIHDDFGIDINYQLASKMLSSPAYYGTLWDVAGMTPAYITHEEYDKIQSMRKHNVRKAMNNRIYLFSGLIVCGDCGRRMSGKMNAASVNPLYNCTGHYAKMRVCSNAVNMNEKKLADYLLDMLEEKLHEYKIEAQKAEIAARDKDYKSEISSIRKKLKRLKELYINELIDMDEYRSDYETFSQKLEELIKKDHPVQRANLRELEEVLSTGWRDTYEEVDREGKRKFWRILIREIRIYPDRRIEFDLNA